MKKTLMQILAMSLIIWLCSANLIAQTRISFRRGSNSATVTGTLAGKGSARTYVLRARRGQVLTATLSSRNGKVDFMQGAVHDTQYNLTVDETGDVLIAIDNHGGATRYTLTISIQ